MRVPCSSYLDRDVSIGNPFVPSETQIYIRFADVDMMNVVHHASYIHWFEQIRFNFMYTVLRITFRDLLASEIALPLISCEASYRKPFRFGDRPVGYAKVTLFKEAKIALHYDVYNRDTGELCTTGVTTHCFLGKEFRMLPRMPEFFVDAIERAKICFPECVLANQREMSAGK